MNDVVLIDGQRFVSSRRGASLSGYTHDYLSRMCRQGKLPGRLISCTWYIEESSLHEFRLARERQQQSRTQLLSESRRDEYQRHQLQTQSSFKHPISQNALPQRRLISSRAYQTPSLSLQEILQRVGTVAIATTLVVGAYVAHPTPLLSALSSGATSTFQSASDVLRNITVSGATLALGIQRQEGRTPTIIGDSAYSSDVLVALDNVSPAVLAQALHFGDMGDEQFDSLGRNQTKEEMNLSSALVATKSIRTISKNFYAYLHDPESISADFSTTYNTLGAKILSLSNRIVLEYVDYGARLFRLSSLGVNTFTDFQNKASVSLAEVPPSLSEKASDLAFSYSRLVWGVADGDVSGLRVFAYGAPEYIGNKVLSLRDKGNSLTLDGRDLIITGLATYVSGLDRVGTQVVPQAVAVGEEKIALGLVAKNIVLRDVGILARNTFEHSTSFVEKAKVIGVVSVETVFFATETLATESSKYFSRINGSVAGGTNKVLTFTKESLNLSGGSITAQATGSDTGIVERTIGFGKRVWSVLFGEDEPTGDVFVESKEETQPVASEGKDRSVPQVVVEQPVIERVVETTHVIRETGLSLTEVEERLQALNNKLQSQIFELAGTASVNSTSIVNNYTTISRSNKIDDLGNVTIHDSNITDSSFSGTSVGATRASFDTLTVDTSFTAPSATFSGSISAPSFTATSTTASSTFAFGVEATRLKLSGLATCNTLDTDASGYLVCGTDETGGGFGQAWELNTNGVLAPTTTQTVFLPSELLASSSARFDGDIFFNTFTSSSTATSTLAGGLTVAGDGLRLTNGLVVTTGGVDLPNSVIDNAELANSTVSYGGIALSLGGTDATPAFDLADATGLPIATGVSGLGANVATFLATPSSANLASAVTNETGTGNLVFSASPTFTGTTNFANTIATNATTTNATSTNLQISSAFTLGSDRVTDITGTGLTLSSGALTLSFTEANLESFLSDASDVFTNNDTIGDANIADTITLTNLTQVTNRAISDTTGTLAIGRGGTGQTSFTNNTSLTINDAGAFTASSTLRDFVIDDALTVSSGGSVDSTALTDGGTISFDWVDGEVADALTISGGTIENTPIGASTPSTAVFSNATTTAATTTSLAISGLLTIGADYINEFAGTGLTVSGNALTADLGTSVDLTAEVTGTLPVGNGGTGATTLTDGGVLLGSGTGAITATAVLTNGQLLIGDGTGDPTVGTLTGGTNLTVSNGAGTITLNVDDAFLVNNANDSTTGQLTALNFVASGASATSTFAGGLAVETSGLVYDFSTNRVGIGTASPGYALQISDTVSPILTIDPGGNATADPTLYLRDTGNTAGFKLWYDNDAGDTYFDNLWDNTSGDLIFRVGVDGTPNQALTILGSGKTGVGSSTPWGTLSVTGDGTGSGIAFAVADLNNTPRLIVQDNGDVGIGSTTPFKRLSVQETVSDAQFSIAYDNARYTNFQVDSTGDFIIDAQGNDLSLLNENLFVCAGGACQTGTPTGTGNLIVETAIGVGSSTPYATISVGPNGAITTTEKTLTDQVTITVSWTNGNQQKVVLGGNRTINFDSYVEGQTLRLVACQDATGSRTVTWDSNVLWDGGTAPTLTTTANKCDVLTFLATNATSTLKVFGSSVLNF